MICGVSSSTGFSEANAVPANRRRGLPRCASATGVRRGGPGHAKKKAPVALTLHPSMQDRDYHKGVVRSSSAGALGRQRPSSGNDSSVSEKRMTQGTHLQGTPMSDSKMSCSWLTSETTALDQLRVNDAYPEEMVSESALRSMLLDYSESICKMELYGSRISTPGLSNTKSFVGTTSPEFDSAIMAPSAPHDSFMLGVPLGLQTAPPEAPAQSSTKPLREVFAVLPRVAGLEFKDSSSILPVASQTFERAAPSTGTAVVPEVPAATIASQLWLPKPGETRWKPLPQDSLATYAPTSKAGRVLLRSPASAPRCRSP